MLCIKPTFINSNEYVIIDLTSVLLKEIPLKQSDETNA